MESHTHTPVLSTSDAAASAHLDTDTDNLYSMFEDMLLDIAGFSSSTTSTDLVANAAQHGDEDAEGEVISLDDFEVNTQPPAFARLLLRACFLLLTFAAAAAAPSGHCHEHAR